MGFEAFECAAVRTENITRRSSPILVCVALGANDFSANAGAALPAKELKVVES